MEAMRSLEKGSRREIGFYSQNLFLLLVLGLLWGVFHLLTLGQPGKFLSPQNLWNLSVQTAVVAILVGGMVLVIVARQIDLSVGSLLGFTGMAMALLQALASGPSGGPGLGCWGRSSSGVPHRLPWGPFLHRHHGWASGFPQRCLSYRPREDHRPPSGRLLGPGRRASRLHRSLLVLGGDPFGSGLYPRCGVERAVA